MTAQRFVPFSLTVEGKVELPHRAERCQVNAVVSSMGINKAAVSDEVMTTAQHLEKLLRDLSPKDDTAEAKKAAPLAHWSKTSLSSYATWNYEKKERQHSASIKFDIRFKDFKPIGAFGATVTALPHVEIQNIQWMLTAATEKSYRAQLRREAVRDALAKANDYCEVLGCTSLRPVQLDQGNATWLSHSTMWQRAPPVSYMQMQCAPGHASSQMNPQNADKRTDNNLEFNPQELRMSMNVTVRFHADVHPVSPGTTLTKRPRLADEDMNNA